MIRLALICLLALALTGAHAAQEELPRLTYQGLGDIRIGMTEQSLSPLGFAPDLGLQDDEEYRACHNIASDQYPGIQLMINYGILVRIDIYEGKWKSLSGAGLGMNEAQLANIYGSDFALDYHPYIGAAGSYAVLQSSNKKYGMIFETAIINSKDASSPKGVPNAKKTVTSFRAGYSEQVNYIEGCS